MEWVRGSLISRVAYPKLETLSPGMCFSPGLPHFPHDISLDTMGGQVDVLIIGAGPAGLTCALGLLRAGVRVRLVDKRFDASSSHYFRAYRSRRDVRVLVGHADGIMPRTVEILQVGRDVLGAIPSGHQSPIRATV
jgi:hypothetical protein